jgi:hypothetical protein
MECTKYCTSTGAGAGTCRSTVGNTCTIEIAPLTALRHFFRDSLIRESMCHELPLAQRSALGNRLHPAYSEYCNPRYYYIRLCQTESCVFAH